MTSPLRAILESKRKLQRELASRPVAEKLRMLEAMRAREIAIRRDRIDLHSRPSVGKAPHA